MPSKKIELVIKHAQRPNLEPELVISGRLNKNELSFAGYQQDKGDKNSNDDTKKNPWLYYDIGDALWEYTKQNPNIKTVSFANAELHPYTLHFIVARILGNKTVATLVLDGVQITSFEFIHRLSLGCIGGAAPHYYDKPANDMTKARIKNPQSKVLSLKGCFKQAQLSLNFLAEFRKLLRGVDYKEIVGNRSLDLKVIIDSPELYNSVLDDKHANGMLLSSDISGAVYDGIKNEDIIPILKLEGMELVNDNNQAHKPSDNPYALISKGLEFTRIPSNVLGKGNFATVYKGSYQGKPAAIKVHEDLALAFNNPDSDVVERNELIEEFEAEAQTLIDYRHKNIVELKAYGVYQEKVSEEASVDNNDEDEEKKDYIDLHILVIEILPTKLSEYITKNAANPKWDAFVVIATHIAEALQYLHNHSKPIVHSDLKPENVMLIMRNNGEITTKLIDTGVSARVHSADTQTFKHGRGGTPQYMAPEQHANLATQRCTIPAEMFSCGLIVASLLAGGRPFSSDIMKNINGHYAKWDGKPTDSQPVNIAAIKNPNNDSLKLSEVVKMCLWKEPGERATASAIVEYLTPAPKM